MENSRQTIQLVQVMNGKSIKVKIFGNEYPLKGDNEDLTKRVASYVDGMLMKIHDKIPEQPPLTVAVLSALNITEDLLQERDKHTQEVAHLEAEVEKLSNYLDNCLAAEAVDQRIQ
ncbi:MAG: cell division protein ZapA [Bacteroidetes bacterium]|nr:cell division protein ZapA [Bacteroidota bacterium]